MSSQPYPPALLTSQSLDRLIDVQEGSVVSRILLKKTSGNVTLFAFAPGEGLSEHTTPHDAIVLMAGGKMEITVGGTAHQVMEGQVLLLPAGIPHALRAEAPSRMILVMIRED